MQPRPSGAPPENGSAALPGARPAPGRVARLVPGAAPLLRPPGVPAGSADRRSRRSSGASRRGSDAFLREWPRIRDEIDAGHPSVVGLIRAAGWSPWAPDRATTRCSPTAYDGDAGRRSRSGSTTPTTRAATTSSCEVGVDRSPTPPRPWRERITMPSRPASRCSASSASPTRRPSPCAPGADRRGWVRREVDPTDPSGDEGAGGRALLGEPRRHPAGRRVAPVPARLAGLPVLGGTSRRTRRPRRPRSRT